MFQRRASLKEKEVGSYIAFQICYIVLICCFCWFYDEFVLFLYFNILIFKVFCEVNLLNLDFYEFNDIDDY